MKLTIQQQILPYDLNSLVVSEQQESIVLIDGKECGPTLSEIILTGLTVMSNTYGKSITQLIEENT